MNEEQFKNDLIEFKEKFLFDEKFIIDIDHEYTISTSDKKFITIWIFGSYDVEICCDISREIFPELKITSFLPLRGILIGEFDYVLESRKRKLKLLENE